jgi:monomeric sarcosine oxidase
MQHYDAIVLGAGGVGSAALYHLARRGVRALGIDRFSPPHDRGSSHGETRVIRQAYFEHSDYVPLLKESYRLWHELEAQTGAKLFHQIGLVEVGPPSGAVVPGVLRAAREHELSVESLTAAEIERLWPGLRAGPELVGVFEPTAGYLRVEACVDSHLDAAIAAGAQIASNTEVFAWKATDREVRLRTSAGELAADRLIVAAGAWAGTMLGELQIPLIVRRQSLFWFAADRAEYGLESGLPVFLFELPAGVFYGFPVVDELGLKVAEHTSGRAIGDALSVDRTVDALEQRQLERFLADYLPGVSRQVLHHAVCLYTMSPDEHFIVDRYPQHGNVVFAAGLSGHGFKFTPVLGKVLAELAIDGATDLPIGFLSLRRLGGGAQCA